MSRRQRPDGHGRVGPNEELPMDLEHDHSGHRRVPAQGCAACAVFDDAAELAALGVSIQDQVELERQVRDEVDRDVAAKEIEVEEKRLRKIENDILKQQRLADDLRQKLRACGVLIPPSGLAHAAAAAADHNTLLSRLKAAELMLEQLRHDKSEVLDRLGDALRRAEESEVRGAARAEQQPGARDAQNERPISGASTPAKRKHDAGHDQQQGIAADTPSSPNLATMIVPKRRAAADAESIIKFETGPASGPITGHPSRSEASANKIKSMLNGTAVQDDSETSFVELDAAEPSSGEETYDDIYIPPAEKEGYDSDSKVLRRDAALDSMPLLRSQAENGDEDEARDFVDSLNTKHQERRQDEAKYGDDGDEGNYRKRLLAWARPRRRQRAQGSSSKKGDQEEDTISSDLEEETYLPHPLYPDAQVEGDDDSQPPLLVPHELWDPLFHYQQEGIRWMYTLFEQQVGGILGDEMGLGKTVQIVAYLSSLYHSRKLTKPSIIVCPATLMRQWVREFHQWWAPLRVVILHGTGSGMRQRDGSDHRDTDLDNEEELASIMDEAMSGFYDSGAESEPANSPESEYEHDEFGWRSRKKRVPGAQRGRRRKGRRRRGRTTSAISAQTLRRAKRLVDQVFNGGHIVVTTYTGLQMYRGLLLKREWGYAVLDEGHTIRNPDAEVTLTCKQLNTHNRLILSGTPIQNNLTELWSLFDFIYPGRLGTLPVFNNQFAVPIKTGGYASASNFQVRAAYECACMLRDLIDPYFLRRLKVDVAKDLPQKKEQVLFCKLTKAQREAYVKFLSSESMSRILEGRLQMLFGIDHIRKICNHPDILRIFSKGHHKSKAGDYNGSYFNSDDDDDGNGVRDARDSSERSSKWDGPDASKVGDSDEDDMSLTAELGDWRKSGKMKVVHALFKMWMPQGHKVLLFTQTRQMLDLLERMARQEPFPYLRMDGTTPVRQRAKLVDQFNTDPSIFLFLLTTKVGGLGVNLTGANRVIIFDPDWNPSTDMQARERAWRLGQTRDVVIYRLMTAGTIEEKIYHRQIYKQFLSDKILSDPSHRRFFHNQSLRDLFSLDRESDQGTTETGEMFAEARVLPPGATAKKEDQYTKPMSSVNTISRDEGEAVSGGGDYGSIRGIDSLAGVEQYRPPDVEEGGNGDGRLSAAQQHGDEGEDRVLSSLFEMAGIHSAMQHDVIIGTRSTYNREYEQIVRTEARKIAQQAAAELSESRTARSAHSISTPTWTGQSGKAGDPAFQQQGVASTPKFGQKLNPRLVKPTPKLIKDNEVPVEVQFGELIALGSGGPAKLAKSLPASDAATPSTPTQKFGSGASAGFSKSSPHTAAPGSASLLSNLRQRAHVITQAPDQEWPHGRSSPPDYVVRPTNSATSGSATTSSHYWGQQDVAACSSHPHRSVIVGGHETISVREPDLIPLGGGGSNRANTSNVSRKPRDIAGKMTDQGRRRMEEELKSIIREFLAIQPDHSAEINRIIKHVQGQRASATSDLIRAALADIAERVSTKKPGAQPAASGDSARPDDSDSELLMTWRKPGISGLLSGRRFLAKWKLKPGEAASTTNATGNEGAAWQ